MRYLHASDFACKTPRQLADRINELYNSRADKLDCFAEPLDANNMFEEAIFLESSVLHRRVLSVLKDGSDVKNAVAEINPNNYPNRDAYLEKLSAYLYEHIKFYSLQQRAALNIIIS